MASTMQLQLATAQTRRVCRPAPKAFVAVPAARRAALQQCAARSPARKVVVKAVAEAQAPAATSKGAQVRGAQCSLGLAWGTRNGR